MVALAAPSLTIFIGEEHRALAPQWVALAAGCYGQTAKTHAHVRHRIYIQQRQPSYLPRQFLSLPLTGRDGTELKSTNRGVAECVSFVFFFSQE